MLVNYFIDNFLRTKIMASNLKVHPALVLIGALVGVQLFGFVGIIIAAPVMASMKLVVNYIINKLNDQNPWEELELREPIETPKWISSLSDNWRKFTEWVKNNWRKLRNKESEPDEGDSSQSDSQDENN